MRNVTGSYVSVGVNVPDSPEFVKSQMDEYVRWVNKHKRLVEMDPVEFSAMAIYKFVSFSLAPCRLLRLMKNY